MIRISTGRQSSDLQVTFPRVLATIYLRFHVFFLFFNFFFYFLVPSISPCFTLTSSYLCWLYIKIKKWETGFVFLSSYRIKSKILGERGILWEHESTGINIMVPSDACGTTSRTHRKYVAPDSNYSPNKWNVKMPFIQYNEIILSTQ